jgi:hypothetical protein
VFDGVYYTTKILPFQGIDEKVTFFVRSYFVPLRATDLGIIKFANYRNPFENKSIDPRKKTLVYLILSIQIEGYGDENTKKHKKLKKR